jgi:hypothetical protein
MAATAANTAANWRHSAALGGSAAVMAALSPCPQDRYCTMYYVQFGTAAGFLILLKIKENPIN